MQMQLVFVVNHPKQQQNFAADHLRRRVADRFAGKRHIA